MAGGAAAPAHAAAAAVNAGAARSTPAMLQGAAAAEVARLPLMRTIASDAASLRAATDKVEADLQQLPQGTQRTQALARFRPQCHMHLIGMAFANEPMYSTTASFDGLSWQLAVKRAIGVEEQTTGCKLCGKSPGGTLHARLCQAPRVKAHDTIVHNNVKRATQRIVRQYLKTGPVDEDYTPFLGSAAAPGSCRINIVLPADAFPVTGCDDPTRQLLLMVDVTCFEAQVNVVMIISAEQQLSTSYPTAKPTAEPTYAPGSSVCDFGPDYTLASMTMTLCMPGYIITDITLSYGTCVYGVSSMVCSRLDGSSKDSPITAVINAGAVGGGTQATVTSSAGFNGASSGWVREGAADAASQLYFTTDAFATSTSTFGYSGSPGAQFICPGAQKLVGLRHIPVKLDSNPGSAIGGIGVVCG
ncbi:hypothetical protein JKP88DRAFT_287612 [Tribonema minus]|uniref:Uncharacterized protein n=1 Tax=Tribonema minus TaxID=303371 RepID=A0A836CJB8_9STRA|nr:hypothetical protein JKP88DRAFT_287612 [Tribonema minus]